MLCPCCKSKLIPNGQWEKVAEGDLTFCGTKCGRYIEQKRTCKLTGRVQFKETITS